MSTLETNLVQPATGTTLTLGASGDTVDVPSGATLDVTGATVTGLSAGKVLQVVNATVNTETVINNNTWTDVGITLAITPSATSSKVLIQANAAGCGKATNNTYLELKLLRDTTDLIVIEQRGGYTADTSANKVGSCACTYLDSPSTTSATTYKLQGRSGSNNAYAQVGDSNPYSTITLMEISA
tara:strand:- start:276 stop:827 length:552 start_codon:yes stop_codon:yes gene_type:complete